MADRCATCHQVPGHAEPTRRLGLDAPTFGEIAEDPAFYSRPRLQMMLVKPHYPMTTFILTTTEVNDLIAYIERLRAP